MKKAILTVVVLLVCAAPAFAQTHPCDTTPGPQAITLPNSNAPLPVGFCWNGLDGNGNVVPTATAVAVVGTTERARGLTITRVNPPNVAGRAFYTVLVPGPWASGTVSLTLALTNSVGTGQASPALTLSMAFVITVPSQADALRLVTP